MKIVVIFKQDGTIQCNSRQPARPLAQDEADLRQAGVSKICGAANVPGPFQVPFGCFTPTGQVNAFAITEEDWRKLKTGIVGTLGFQLWTNTAVPSFETTKECTVSEDPASIGFLNPAGSQPILIRELIGRPLRSYEQGAMLTADFRPERVNIEHDAAGLITRIWFG